MPGIVLAVMSGGSAFGQGLPAATDESRCRTLACGGGRGDQFPDRRGACRSWVCCGPAPTEVRGTAFGIFNLITGLALLLASVIAGALWDSAGPQGTFLAGAGFAVMATGGLLSIRSRLRNHA